MTTDQVLGLRSRFDWYEITFDGWDDAASTLSLVVGGDIRSDKGRNGYAKCQTIVRGGDELVRVYSHSARLGELHVVTSGQSCDEVVPVLRRLWPEHRVSRADSAVDVKGDFDVIDEQAVEFARLRNLSYRLVTDSDGGATRYLGAPSSEVRVRVYKKSEQLRALHPERAHEVPDGVVRFELQARPGKRDGKSAASRLAADDLWGLTRWGESFAESMLGFAAERTRTHFWRPSDWERSKYYLGQQYGRLVRQRVASIGLEAALAELAEAFGV